MWLGECNQDFRYFAPRLQIFRDQRVLDLGCGPGLYSRALIGGGSWLVSIDKDRAMLEKSQVLIDDRPLRVVQGDAPRLPFRDGSFDAVVSVEVLTHINPLLWSVVLREIRRVLRPGGKCILTAHNSLRLGLGRISHGRRPCKEYIFPHTSIWPTTPACLLDEARNAGFVYTDRLEYLNYSNTFSDTMYRQRRLFARCIIWWEDALRRIPILRRLAITFAVIIMKPMME